MNRKKRTKQRRKKNESNKKINSFFLFFITVTADARVKRQDDDENAEQNIEELCQDRPGDEYFRLLSDGDCRDVVRYESVPTGCKNLNFYDNSTIRTL